MLATRLVLVGVLFCRGRDSDSDSASLSMQWMMSDFFE